MLVGPLGWEDPLEEKMHKCSAGLAILAEILEYFISDEKVVTTLSILSPLSLDSS